MSLEQQWTRRHFVLSSATATLAAGTLSPFEALARGRSRRQRRAREYRRDASLGPLAPAPDRSTGLSLLALPNGFEYVSFGWTHDRVDAGETTPPLDEGMGCFRSRRHQTLLTRDHAGNTGRPLSTRAPVYDPAAAGGTTSIRFDRRRGSGLSMRPSLAGTLRNCAGGMAPWNSWITCEDGRGSDRLLALNRRGELNEVVRGNVVLSGERGFFGDFRTSELAGACFDRDGDWMFLNIQRPGLTVAIRGPWWRAGR